MFISTVVCLVPVVDCSEAVGIVEMTEVSYYNCVTLVLVHVQPSLSLLEE